MPTFSHTVDVMAPRSQVFAILDDVARTPEWLARCTGIDTLSDGPNQVGTALRYHYKDGGRPGQMDGAITVHHPGEHLAMLYTDKLMDVLVDFVTAPGATDDVTRLTHTIDIRPHGVGRVFTPIIKVTLPRQTRDAMTRLKTLAESEAR